LRDAKFTDQSRGRRAKRNPRLIDIMQAVLDEGDCKVRDVDADPAPVQPLGDRDGCSASGQWVSVTHCPRQTYLHRG
jgi:hypothetical protein